MSVGRPRTRLKYSLIGAVVVMSAWPPRAQAQNDHDHLVASPHYEQTSEQKRQASALVKAVRDATAGFRDSAAAESQQYFLHFGCVSGSDFGAMGMHFVNFNLVDGDIDVSHPEILLYEPLPNGRLRLIGADYLVPKAAGEANPAHKAPPELMGQLFTCLTSPIVSGSARSTRCTSGHGRRTPTARSRTGIPTFRATHSTR